MPIYLMFIRVLPSVEFYFTLKTYLKGAPFYNASVVAVLLQNPFSLRGADAEPQFHRHATSSNREWRVPGVDRRCHCGDAEYRWIIAEQRRRQMVQQALSDGDPRDRRSASAKRLGRCHL